MFERFNESARESVVLAQAEARELRHRYIGTEHLLLGILRLDTSSGQRALKRLGIGLEQFRSDVVREIGSGPEPVDPARDEEALRALGIDVKEVRRRIEEAFGPGALDRRVRQRRRRFPRRRCEPTSVVAGYIPLTPRTKKVLVLSLREAIRLGHRSIGTEHILLGIAREGEGVAAKLLAARGASPDRIRQAVGDELSTGEGRSA